MPSPEPDALASLEPSPEPDALASLEPSPEPDALASLEPSPEPDALASLEPSPEPDALASLEPSPEPDALASLEPSPEPPLVSQAARDFSPAQNPSANVTKIATPSSLPEPGGSVSFSVTVANTAPETIELTALVDDVHGNLSGQGDCLVPQTIPETGSYACSFTVTLSGNAGESETDTITATVSADDVDAFPTGSATVSFTDVEPTIDVSKSASTSTIDEPGGPVTFSVIVRNTSPEPITLDSLSDDVYGDVTTTSGNIVSTDCTVGQTIPAGESYGCAFVGPVTGNALDVRTDTVTALASDDEGNIVEGTAEATVTIANVIPTISLSKIASPTTRPEPGGSILYRIAVSNSSPEDVVLGSLIDDIHGSLAGRGTCALPQTLVENGGRYRCSFTVPVLGDAGYVETNELVATATDNDGSTGTATATASVTITDVLPAMSLQKSASPSSLVEPGGDYVVNIVVNNLSTVEDIELTALVDEPGTVDLNGDGDCTLPQTIRAGGSYSCSIDRSLIGNAGDSESDTVTATASDDEGNVITASDGATFSIIDLLPSIDVTKTADPTTLPEPGGNVTFTVRVDNLANEPATITEHRR